MICGLTTKEIARAFQPHLFARIACLIEPVWGAAQAHRIGRAWRELMLFWRRMTMLFVFFALAGCTSVVAGPAQAPNAPYQQGDPRDTSGMH
jgi:hypothetical protein